MKFPTVSRRRALAALSSVLCAPLPVSAAPPPTPARAYPSTDRSSSSEPGTGAQLEPAPVPEVHLAIIIDDLGNTRREGLRALELPGQLTYAFLPHTPHGRELSELAFSLGKEVMLHLPMEARSGKHLGPGGLDQHMSRPEIEYALHSALEDISRAQGVSNHMGSLLTAMPDRMEWIMMALDKRAPLYFVDSNTYAGSVAYETARAMGLRAVRRDVFLDHERDPLRISSALDRLIELTKVRGHAVGIGHPYAETMTVLARRLPALYEVGVRTVPVSKLLAAGHDLLKYGI